jgi:hypothetical protein
VHTINRFLSPTGIFAGFYLYIINIAGRICKAAMGGAEVAQRPVFPVKDPIKTVGRCAQARTRGQKLLMQTYSSVYETNTKVFSSLLTV